MSICKRLPQANVPPDTKVKIDGNNDEILEKLRAKAKGKIRKEKARDSSRHCVAEGPVLTTHRSAHLWHLLAARENKVAPKALAG